MMNIRKILAVAGLLFLSLVLVGCAKEQLSTPEVHIANPASEFCAKQGGTLQIEIGGDGGEYGLCVFSENLACEEWAMYNGNCPVGGIDLTGIESPQARYCLVRGNQYTTIEYDTAPPTVKELCVLTDGSNCLLLDYYAGRCFLETTPTP